MRLLFLPIKLDRCLSPRLLVFDLDGTLIDSTLDLCNSVNATLEHLGKAPLPNSLIASYIGDGAAMLVRRALGDPGDLDASAHDETQLRFALDFFISYYRLHKLDNTLAYDGVLASLQAIRERHPALPMAVLTNKPVRPSREICKVLGMEPFFFQNYGGGSFTTKKPGPLGLQTLVSEANAILHARGDQPLQPEEVVMIARLGCRRDHRSTPRSKIAGVRDLYLPEAKPLVGSNVWSERLKAQPKELHCTKLYVQRD